MEESASPERKSPAKAGPIDTIMAYVMAGVIVVWLLAYTYFALRAWIGRA